MSINLDSVRCVDTFEEAVKAIKTLVKGATSRFGKEDDPSYITPDGIYATWKRPTAIDLTEQWIVGRVVDGAPKPIAILTRPNKKPAELELIQS